MHANVQTSCNPAIGEKAPYYRLKESYRDVRGNVHSLILLNVGFDPSIDALQAKKIARALTNRFENRHAKTLFSERLNGLTEHEQAKADEWWNRMIQEGGIDRFNKREQAARKEAEHYIDLNTAKHTDAHLFFGLLAYWVVNTIRCGLKAQGENCYWREIVRRMSKQKLVTTEGVNPLGEKVEMRQCSKPSKQATEIYQKLGLREAPFRKIKICRTQSP